MKKTKVTIIANAIFGKILTITGYVFGVTFLLSFIITLTEGGDIAIIGVIVMLVFTALSVLLIIRGAQIKRRIKRYKKYIALISKQQMTSLENIAASTNKTVDFVNKDLQTMINKNFFADAHIDTDANEITISRRTADTYTQAQGSSQTELVPYVCPGCDDSGIKPKGKSIICDFCGNTISYTNER